jgi:hypothetical protein
VSISTLSSTGSASREIVTLLLTRLAVPSIASREFPVRESALAAQNPKNVCMSCEDENPRRPALLDLKHALLPGGPRTNEPNKLVFGPATT